jgi:hypothetical protein
MVELPKTEGDDAGLDITGGKGHDGVAGGPVSCQSEEGERPGEGTDGGRPVSTPAPEPMAIMEGSGAPAETDLGVGVDAASTSSTGGDVEHGLVETDRGGAGQTHAGEPQHMREGEEGTRGDSSGAPVSTGPKSWAGVSVPLPSHATPGDAQINRPPRSNEQPPGAQNHAQGAATENSTKPVKGAQSKTQPQPRGFVNRVRGWFNHPDAIEDTEVRLWNNMALRLPSV